MLDAAGGVARDSSEGQDSGATDPVVSTTPEQATEKKQGIGSAARAPANVSMPATPAPAATASPLVAGVASGITGALGAPRDAATAPSASQRIDPAAAMAATDPVRTIALNLDMREYGMVDLRISLKGNAVSIQIKAERAETAEALTRGDASLRDLLHRAGYEAQQIQVDRRDATQTRLGDASASGQQQQQAGGTGTGGFSGHAAGDQRAATPGQRTGAERADAAFALQDQDTHDAPRQDRYRGPDRLYV